MLPIFWLRIFYVRMSTALKRQRWIFRVWAYLKLLCSINLLLSYYFITLFYRQNYCFKLLHFDYIKLYKIHYFVFISSIFVLLILQVKPCKCFGFIFYFIFFLIFFNLQCALHASPYATYYYWKLLPLYCCSTTLWLQYICRENGIMVRWICSHFCVFGFFFQFSNHELPPILQ